MRRTVLGKTRNELASSVKLMRLVMLFAVLLALVLNACLVALRNEANHVAIMVMCMIADIASLWFVIAFYDLVFLPSAILYDIMKESSTRVNAVIKHTENVTEKRRRLDCIRVITDEEEILFLPVCSKLELKSGDNVSLYTVSGIITEVETV